MFSSTTFKSAAFAAVGTSFVWGPGALLQGGLAFNPLYGVGITSLIAIHEAGHVLACKFYGISSEAPVFGGAFAYIKHDVPVDAYKAAMVALAGPVVGSLGALSYAGVGYYMDSPILMDLGGTGLVLNFMNLLPIRPLDGGSIVRAISPALTVGFAGASCVGVGALAVSGYTSDVSLLNTALLYTEIGLVVGLGSIAAYNIIKKTEVLPNKYFRIGFKRKAGLFAAYVASIAAMIAAFGFCRENSKDNLDFKQAEKLKEQGKLDEAEPLYRSALEVRERVFGVEHKKTLLYVSVLGLLLEEQGKMEEAEPLYRRVLEVGERVFGVEHENTLNSVGNLGRLLWKQGKIEEAEKLYRRVLEVRERVLGVEHEVTLIYVSILGLLLKKQGKFDEAEPLIRRVLEGRERVLGVEHEVTLIDVSILGLLLKKQGKFDEAEPLIG